MSPAAYLEIAASGVGGCGLWWQPGMAAVAGLGPVSRLGGHLQRAQHRGHPHYEHRAFPEGPSPSSGSEAGRQER